MIPHPTPNVKDFFRENYKISSLFSGKTEIWQNVPQDEIFGRIFQHFLELAVLCWWNRRFVYLECA